LLTFPRRGLVSLPMSSAAAQWSEWTVVPSPLIIMSPGDLPTSKGLVEFLNKLVKSPKEIALQRPGMRRVVAVEGSDNDRLLLLDPASVSSPNSFSDAEALRSFGVPQELQRNKLRLTYDNLKSEEVLRFSRVGHIAHMNLREHQLLYRNLIGQVIMDKNPGVTCVVNKTNTIDSTYRFFKMEVMVGEENMVTKFDFSCVYWNCHGVHLGVIRAVPRATEAEAACPAEGDSQCTCDVKLPQVYCYGFSKEYDRQRDMVERASASLGLSQEGPCSVHLVRNVAPNKEMMCVTFTIPKEVLFSSKNIHRQVKEPAPKRQKCGETKD
uniref:tRNA methyltransferase 5 n=1 Tax=Salmo trutta TaxID=8032 RepID=A0A674DSA2_SALTR